MAKKIFNSDVNIPIVEDAFDTKESPAADQGVLDERVYDECGGEETIYELIRTSSAAHAASCRRLKWFSLYNVHLVVYIMFFVVLTIFSVYYGVFSQEGALWVVPAIAACFMIYVIARGHSLFTFGMAFDEEKAEGVLACKFCTDKIYVRCTDEESVVPYTAVSGIRCTKHHIYLRVKGKAFPDGILLEKPGDSVTADGIMSLVKSKMKK